MKRLMLVAVLCLAAAGALGVRLLGDVLIHPDTTELARTCPAGPTSGCVAAYGQGNAGEEIEDGAGAIRREPVPMDLISSAALEAVRVGGRLVAEVRPEHERFPQWNLAELFVSPSSDPRLQRIRTRILAWRLSRGLSVERMTDLLINLAPFGDGTCGIEAASMLYCRKPARMLTPEEGAVLAARMLVPFGGDPQVRRREVRYWANRIHSEMVRSGSAVLDFSGRLDQALEAPESPVLFDSGIPPVTRPLTEVEGDGLPPLNRSAGSAPSVPLEVLGQ